MKILFCFLFILFVSFIYAEDTKDDFKIEILECDSGNNKAEFSISSILNTGEVYFGFDNSPKYLAWNASNLGFIKKPMICLDTIFFPLSINQKKEFEDISFYDEKLPINQVVNFKVKQKTGIYGFAFCYPFFDTTIGLFVEKPLIGALNISSNGIFAKMKITDKSQNIILLNSNFDFNINSLFKLDIFRFGFGRRITPFLNLGVGLNYYHFLASMDLKSKIDIKASLNYGDLISFGDDNTSLGEIINIQYQKNCLGFNLGGSLGNLILGLKLDFAYNYIPVFNLEGKLTSISTKPKFLEEKDLTNITKETLTIVNEDKNESKDYWILKMPSNLNLGFTHKNLFFTTGINFIKYLNQFSITQVKVDEKSETQYDTIFSANPNFALKLGFDFKLLKIGVGVTMITIEENDIKRLIPIPSISIKICFKIIPQLKTNIEIIGTPGPLLKTSFELGF